MPSEPVVFNDEDPTPCKHVTDLAQDQLDLAALVMARLEQQDKRIAQQSSAIEAGHRHMTEMRQQLGTISEMLKTFGDLCYSLAAEAEGLERRSADS